jgi:phage-related protein
MIDFDEHINKIDSIDESDQRSALTEVLASVASLNGDVSGGQDALVMAGLPDRLKEWLDKLVAKLQAIVRDLSEVASFTVSVGTPFNVSVAVTFAKSS